MLKEKLRKNLLSAISGWLEEKSLDGSGFSLDFPPKEFKSDLAFSAALSIAKILKENPRKIADQLRCIVDSKLRPGVIESSSIAGPGFINLNLSIEFLIKNFAECVDKKFRMDEDKLNEKVCIEFVSANPTGPLHVGHGRGAAIGDSLARVFGHFGAEVVREYYVNNIGNQIQILGKSVEARMNQLQGRDAKFPEDGYKGEYIKEIAREYIDSGSKTDIEDFAYEKILDIIKDDLNSFRVDFDKWSYENEIHKEGFIDKSFEILKQKGMLYDSDGALWLKSTVYGDEKDRVVKRSDGRYTYLASDIAYHYEKVSRSFNRIIDIWGADHYGYQKRIEAVINSLEFNSKGFNVILYQLVRLMRDKQIVSMSTRSGEFITLKEVADEVGADACRFFFLLRSPQSHLDFDMELAKKHTSDNPVYYVQYAHARICSIFKEAQKRNVEFENTQPSAETLASESERELLKKVVFFPDLLKNCLRDLTPHYITTYLIDTVRMFHAYYDNYRVVSDDKLLTQARLFLMNGLREMISAGLRLLGVAASEKM